ncbi:DUF3276 family protein [Microbacter margulisiae]|uniref:DUF3276 family protein n=1 Tax=Microbacter margulisiae TaxID=1350067 RepID=A0A7W5H2E6_9PORP|nr:DUF3276 family protein [Microbacter margulisiae]MBB3187549.1 hypothetical protein [Microbacter margulisiae]
MKESNSQNEDMPNDRDIYYSQRIKAGKRIYYFDMKKSRFGDYYLVITESKKEVIVNDADNPIVSFERHRIFLYQEDFDEFLRGLHELIDLINIKNDTIALVEEPVPDHTPEKLKKVGDSA